MTIGLYTLFIPQIFPAPLVGFAFFEAERVSDEEIKIIRRVADEDWY